MLNWQFIYVSFKFKGDVESKGMPLEVTNNKIKKKKETNKNFVFKTADLDMR